MPLPVAKVLADKDREQGHPKMKDAILRFLYEHPGYYFSVHDFKRFETSGRDASFWWLASWSDPQRVQGSQGFAYLKPESNSAPEGFSVVGTQDPRGGFAGPEFVGKSGTPDPLNRPAGARTLAELDRERAKNVQENDVMLETVHEFLTKRAGQAFTAWEMANELFPRPRWWWTLARRRKEEHLPNGLWATHLRVELDDLAQEAGRRNEVLYKDLRTEWNSGAHPEDGRRHDYGARYYWVDGPGMEVA